MKPTTHVVAHGYEDAASARVAVERAAARCQQRFAKHQPTIVWSDAETAEISFVVYARVVRATVTVDDDNITFSVQTPVLFRPFERRARSMIDRHLPDLLAADNLATRARTVARMGRSGARTNDFVDIELRRRSRHPSARSRAYANSEA